MIMMIYLELLAASVCPLELVLEGRRPPAHRLEHLVELAVLGVGLVVHGLVLHTLRRRHDRAEVAAREI